MRLDRLDHLRFVAAFAVASWHFTHLLVSPAVVPKWPILSILEEGYTGVSLFCAISGFIFTWIYFDRAIPLKEFAQHRALRVVPLYLLIVALTYYTSAGFTATDVLTSLLTGLSKALPGYAAPSWTIMIELQFYALFPALIYFSRKYGTGYLVGLLILFIAIRIMVWLSSGNSQFLAYWTLFGRMDQFLAGMLSAILLKSAANSVRARSALMVVGALALAAIVSFAHYLNVNGGFFDLYGGKEPSSAGIWVIYPTIEAVCYSCIIVGYLALPPISGRIAAVISAAFAYCGRISYSIYLTHFLVIGAVLTVIGSLGFRAYSWEAAQVLFLWTGLPAILLVSSASYYLIERPFYDLRSVAKRAAHCDSKIAV